MRTINSNKQQVPLQSTIQADQSLPMVLKIKGLVTNIVDGNTFEMSIHNNGSISGQEKRSETIRIQGMNKPSISTLSGILAKLELEKKIVGRILECEIVDKNDQEQLIAIVPQKYLQSAFLAQTDQD
ncbi:MAG: hypothetical protein K9N35_01050 [Candidatus Marinimicrobia bacterium]|nr:hypothetical protein [Candidatus Neomarinimicrobiota bacterium]